MTDTISDNSEQGALSQTKANESMQGASLPASEGEQPSIQPSETSPVQPSIGVGFAEPQAAIQQENMQTEETNRLSPSPESLRTKYSRLAEEYRSLWLKQIDGNLTPDEMKRRQELEKMAGYGLFEKDQSESQLRAKEAVYQAHNEAASKELSDPAQLAEEFRSLGRKLIEKGLGPGELERYIYLKSLSRSGRFEQLGAAS